jgi:hypothetical protein
MLGTTTTEEEEATTTTNCRVPQSTKNPSSTRRPCLPH